MILHRHDELVEAMATAIVDAWTEGRSRSEEFSAAALILRMEVSDD